MTHQTIYGHDKNYPEPISLMRCQDSLYGRECHHPEPISSLMTLIMTHGHLIFGFIGEEARQRAMEFHQGHNFLVARGAREFLDCQRRQANPMPSLNLREYRPQGCPPTSLMWERITRHRYESTFFFKDTQLQYMLTTYYNRMKMQYIL